MQQIIDERFAFSGYGRCPGHCRLRVYKETGRALVVIATELPGNPGTSVTNMAGALATVVWRWLEQPREMIWVEHYPETFITGQIIS